MKHVKTKHKRKAISETIDSEQEKIDDNIIGTVLAESLEQYRILFEQNLDAILVADSSTGIIVDCNPAALKMFDRERCEIIGQHQAILHPLEGAEKQYTNVFKEHLKNPTITLETQIITKNGVIRDVAIRASVFEIREKKLMQGTFRDITERKRAAEQIKKLKEFDERIIDSLGEALLIIDPEDFTIINANKSAYEQLGLERETLIGRKCFEATHSKSSPCEPPEHICPITKMQECGKPVTAEHIHFDSEHHKKWVEVSAYPVKDIEGKTVVVHISRDITERKFMIRDLEASEEKFRAISNSVRDSIILVDSQGKVEYWNPAAEKTFGYSEEEVIGKKVHSLLVPQSMCPQGKAVIKRGFARFKETGSGPVTAGNVELVGQRKDGSEFPIKLSVSPIKLQNKWHAAAVVKDITERKHSEQLAKEYSEKLEKAVEARTNELKEANASMVKLERLAAIGELAGMIGHDLRNPLAGINNAIYYLKKNLDSCSADNKKVMLESIEASIRHADKIINDLLDYARDIRLEFGNCSPAAILSEALTCIKIPSSINMLNTFSDAPEIRVDRDKLLRVFVNLIKNAIEAMPQGGSLRILSNQTNGNVEFSFEDTGVGIPEAILPKIFLPLMTTKAQGMGFGLAICKRLVEAHKGKITVKSKLGEGSIFTVVIPIKPNPIEEKEKMWVQLPESFISPNHSLI